LPDFVRVPHPFVLSEGRAPASPKSKGARCSKIEITAGDPMTALTSKRIVYVDVDDTLVRSFGSKRIPMSEMVALIPKLAENATLYCWSSGGAEYARSSAEELGIAECFAAFLPKPHVLIDDVSISKWKLIELHPNECRGLDVVEILERGR
jgi:hypothetical protein